MQTQKKTTLIHSVTEMPYLNEAADQRVIPCRNLRHLRAALSTGIEELGEEVERVLINEADYRSFLQFLADMPAEFRGDVLLIDNDCTAFMSSVGRGGDRVIYALDASDLQFYMRIHGLSSSNGCEREVA